MWRGLDQDGDVIDRRVTKLKDCQAAKSIFRNAWNHHGQAPWRLMTEKRKNEHQIRIALMRLHAGSFRLLSFDNSRSAC